MSDIATLVAKIDLQTKAIDKLITKLGASPPAGGGGGNNSGGGNNAGGNNAGGGGNARNAEQERQEQERRRQNIQANAQAQVQANNDISKSVEKMLSTFDKLSNVGKSVFGSMEEYSAYASAKYDAIQEMFGGIPEDVREGQTRTARRAVRDIDNIYKVYLNNQHKFNGLMIERNGHTLNALEAFYKDEAEIASNYYEIRGELANRQTVKFNEMAQEDILKLSVMEKGFEISNQKVGQILERQISTTGEASTRIFDEISAYSKSVSKATGVSYKEIAGQISDIITDVERFGNVQVDEAARIAGALNELGLSYQGFGGMVDKFMNFDNAAESLGNLTTVFGVHFDAMEMMQLANEDQEEFLHRMRDAFLDSGKAVEDMTLAEKKLASQQMGMSIQDFENFMQEDRELSDLKSETAKVDEQEITQGFKTMTQQMKLVPKTAEDMKKMAIKKGLDPLSQEAYKTGQQFQAMKKHMALNPGKFLPGYVEFHTGLQQTMKAVLAGEKSHYAKQNDAAIKLIDDQIRVKQSTLANAAEFEKEFRKLKEKGSVTQLDLAKLMMSKHGSAEISAEIAKISSAQALLGKKAAKNYLETTSEGREALAQGIVPDPDKIARSEATEKFLQSVDQQMMQGLIDKDMVRNSPSKYGRAIGDGFEFDASAVIGNHKSSLSKISAALDQSVPESAAAAMAMPLSVSKSMIESIGSEQNRELLASQVVKLGNQVDSSMTKMMADPENPIAGIMKGKADVKVSSPKLIEKLQTANDRAILAAEASQKETTEKTNEMIKSLSAVLSVVSQALNKEATVNNVLEIDGKAIASQLMKIKVNDVGFALTNAGGDSL